MENNLQYHLNNYILEPQNPEFNYRLGEEYEKLQQNAAALSYYLRCAELSNDTNFVYNSLIKTFTVVNQVGGREWYERQQLLLALEYDPFRPEAYYLLSLYHSRRQEWFESYKLASNGLKLTPDKGHITTLNVGYPGRYALIFQKAHTGWYVGRRDESKKIFIDLYKNNYDEMNEEHQKLIKSNLEFFKIEI